MNKKNKILIGCLALLLVLSVGYALFSETVTINGTATAQGDFDITVSSVELSPELQNQLYSIESPGGIYQNPDVDIRDNVVNTSVTLGSPGSNYTFTIKVENTGSIPAKLKEIKNITTNEVILNEETDGDDTYIVGTKENSVSAYLTFDDGYMDDYETDISERFGSSGTDYAMLDAVLDPGESVYYFIYYEWVDNSTVQGDPLALSWSVKFDFEQVTAN